jgi:hypothetical protein
MDMKRWEFMDDEGARESQKLQLMNDQARAGRSNRGGAAFNILNLQYENTPEGQVLAGRDEDNRVRQLLRSKNMDMRGNSGFNLLNGGERVSIDVPQHRVYNPAEAGLSGIGARIIGSGYAGKPLRKELFDPKPSSSASQQ